jgi:predicted helicase
MYVRFWRWASDRMNNEGVIAFVCNRNFIDKVAFDGFRKTLADEFAECWIMDLGGDVRGNPKLSGSKHNVFGIQTGVAIVFAVRKGGASGFKLFYSRRPEDDSAVDKLAFLDDVQDFERWRVAPLSPDAKGNWLSGEHADWRSHIPLADPSRGPSDAQGAGVEAIFRLSSNGVTTQRDEWVWAHDLKTLRAKSAALVSAYEAVRTKAKGADRSKIKWDRELDQYLKRGITKKFEPNRVQRAFYRPFVAAWLYFDQHFNAMTYRLPSLYRTGEPNPTIAFRGVGSEDPLAVLAVTAVFDAGLVKTGNGRTFGVTRYRYTKSGERLDNITDWALRRFRSQYDDSTITKDDIFAYVYAALHDPVFRKVHADDLRREFPRVPLHEEFARWRDWGRTLLDLHIGYEKVKPWPVKRVDAPSTKSAVPKAILKSKPDEGLVVVDSETQITGIPREAWDYRLGNRSAIDWVLDQHKEKRPRDPTVAAKFNTYRFAQHKEAMIKLLAKVVRVSMGTVAITRDMEAARNAAIAPSGEEEAQVDLTDLGVREALVRAAARDVAQARGIELTEAALDVIVRPGLDWQGDLTAVSPAMLTAAIGAVLDALPRGPSDGAYGADAVDTAMARSACHYLWLC